MEFARVSKLMDEGGVKILKMNVSECGDRWRPATAQEIKAAQAEEDALAVNRVNAALQAAQKANAVKPAPGVALKDQPKAKPQATTESHGKVVGFRAPACVLAPAKKGE